jgi:preprotein translocase subunit SecF
LPKFLKGIDVTHVAAIPKVVVYPIDDHVVVFDRFRENSKETAGFRGRTGCRERSWHAP